MVTHFFVLRGSGTNLDISGIFITIPIIIFKDLQTSLITFYIYWTKKVKEIALNRLEFKTIFFIYIHNFQAQHFLIN